MSGVGMTWTLVCPERIKFTQVRPYHLNRFCVIDILSYVYIRKVEVCFDIKKKMYVTKMSWNCHEMLEMSRFYYKMPRFPSPQKTLKKK